MSDIVKKFFKPVSVLLIPLVFSCGIQPFSAEKDDIPEQYQFAAWVLKNYFIFQERLPADLYGFSSPEELYLSVNEPYTRFYTTVLAEVLRNMVNSESEVAGIGLLMDSVYNGYVIKDVFPDAPGERAGLLRRDTVIEVSGQSTAGMNWNSVQNLINGVVGTEVTLGIKRGDTTFNQKIILDIFKSPTVFVDTIDSVVAFIRLSMFIKDSNIPGGSAQEFKNALRATEWAQYTILDLRGNPGGMVNQCLEIAGEMVKTNSPVIRSQERQMDERYNSYTFDTVYSTSGNGSAADRNLIILADNNSASASEILISCIKENRPEVILIGDTTYGKARMQVWADGPDRVMAIVTCGLLSPPLNGTPYDMVGIPPDIPVEPGQDAFDVALTVINGTLAKSKRTGKPGRYYTDGKKIPSVPLCILQK